MIYENGALLAEAERFAAEPQLIVADIDLERLVMDRIRQNTFGDNADALRDRLAFRTRRLRRRARPRLRSRPERDGRALSLRARDDARLNELCFEAYNIQSHGLRKRMESARVEKIVIGVSGGLDSTQALLVAAHTFDALGLPRKNILAYTLPAFATSKGTKTNAWRLMKALGVTRRRDRHDAGLPADAGRYRPPLRAGASRSTTSPSRTCRRARAPRVLFRLANQNNGLVLGTGDLSELALGWCTYGVGDHMSHYNVNGSVSKTLIQHLIRWVAQSQRFGADASAAMLDILATEISPELVPGEGDGPSQKTEDFVGPYALQDFNLFYITRYRLLGRARSPSCRIMPGADAGARRLAAAYRGRQAASPMIWPRSSAG